MKITISLLLFSAFLLHGREPKLFTLERKEIKLENEGISFKPFKDLKAKTKIPLRTRKITRTSKSEKTYYFAHYLDEVWSSDNKLVKYDNDIVKLTLYKLDSLIPKFPKAPSKLNNQLSHTLWLNFTW